VQEALLALLPEDRGLARNELDKLAVFAHQRDAPVTMPEALALLAAEAEAALDEATLAALAGRFGPAIEALDRLDGVSGISALKALQRRLLRLLEARGHIDRGASAAEAGDKLRPKVFWSEKEAFAAQLRVWTTRRLLVGLNILWQAEIAAKSAGSPQDLIAADAFRRVAGVVGPQAGD
jgi:DNA polymerase-3 subunit delta